MKDKPSEDRPLIGDLTGAGKIADSKIANKVYDDALAPLLRQFGHLAEDVGKTARLLLFPLQMLASRQDRFVSWIEQISDDVPPDKRQEASPEITGPALRNLVFMDDNNPLAQLYIELLKKAVNKERSGDVHPAFIRIIEHLSPDEALVLYVLSLADIKILSAIEIYIFDFNIEDSFPKPERLEHPNRRGMYYTHLESLSLVKIMTRHTERPREAPVTNVELTFFGKQFVEACIPRNFSLVNHD